MAFFSFFEVELTFSSVIVIAFYAVSFIGGDYCYAKSIPHVPIGLANLIGSGQLFLILICDIVLGYISPKPIFFLLFLIFASSIIIFSKETNKMKASIMNKKIDLSYVVLLFISIIFYSAEPYFIKLASSKGANEFGINLVSMFFSILWWGMVYFKNRGKKTKDTKSKEQKFFRFVFGVGFLYSIADILYMMAYVLGTSILISLIFQLQVFLVVLISVFQKTDKMNFKKGICLFFSVLSLVLMTIFT